MITELELKKMVWHSRRGMLELDLLLVPFAEKHLRQLDEAEQELYQRLLSMEDQDLFSWLIEREQPSDEGLKLMVSCILERRQ